ncbi:hypothetical protein GA0061102_105030 [Rhizobium miluonense]|uniref:Uncharacterized protein n=1 Tax=Rhizobium miluonense TaxID=411945 RepID=A0A1C3X1H2_9HYPH|nr:hypothetical protein GA0061102_105030 [Rhizobium miluonense]
MPLGGSQEINASGSTKATKIACGFARITLDAVSVRLDPEVLLIASSFVASHDNPKDAAGADCRLQLALMRITFAAIFSASSVGLQAKMLSGRPAAHQTLS